MEFPNDRLYSDYHLWVKAQENGAVIGITSYAVEELGAVDYVELPRIRQFFERDEAFGIVETSKAVTDLVAPISGTVLQTNTEVTHSPIILGEDPYGDGWLIAMLPAALEELTDLLSPEQYGRIVERLMIPD